ncbi:MAG: MarR family transcriptional regulator [Planctomycetota bacterium]|nr:MarR family transcriptional regulator [Planctomycetota bacterium]
MRISEKGAGLWIRLAKCNHLLLREVRGLHQDSSVTLPQFDVLSQLLRHPDGMRTGALSEALLVTAGNVTGITRRLLRSGLISVRSDDRDRRVKIHRLTPAGRRVAIREVRRMERFLDAVFSEMIRHDQADLRRSLDRLRLVLEARRAAG